jgi:hypothetical protein
VQKQTGAYEQTRIWFQQEFRGFDQAQFRPWTRARKRPPFFRAADGRGRCSLSAVPVVFPRIWAGMVDISAQRAEEPRRNRSRTIRPELAFYRKHTEGMLRRYVSMSLESGRVPSLLGKEMFRGNVTSYKVNSFEDVVIFIHDMERCIGRLDERQQRLIRRIAVQQFTLQEVAGMLKVPRTSVLRLYNETINRLTGVLLEVKLLEPFAY